MEMLNNESSILQRSEQGTRTLMTSLVRALRDGKRTVDIPDMPSSRGLTVSEVLGNIFVINFAGHDTTANTLAFAMLMLTANPEIQNWVSEEVRKCVGDPP